MPIDKMTREIIAVDGTLFRKAMAAAYCTALNNNPEGIPDPQHEAAQFVAMACEWHYSIADLRKRMQSRLGGSAAYRSIPDLFTKEAAP